VAEVRLKQYLVTLRVRVSEDALLQHSSSSPLVIGNELARQIHDYVSSHQMAYYPALDFFINNVARHDGLDPDLIDATDSMSWLLCRLVRYELQSKLRQAFSALKFQTVQTIAYTMPAVRYSSKNALYELAQHYSPLSLKLDMVLSLVDKELDNDEVHGFIENALHKLLKDSFESIEISNIVTLAE